jgi:predicted amidohydrolase YtcJ
VKSKTRVPPLPVVDIVLHGGRISTLADPEQGPGEVEAIAIASGRVIAIGTDEELSPLRALAARVVDLEGRRVLPGLNDSHTHAVRAGLSWTRTMHWEDARTLDEVLQRTGEDAARRGPGTWVCVVGGWHSSQLAERRAPTRNELDIVAPKNPVYVQELYDRGILNSAGLRACGFSDDSADPPGGRLLREDAGRLTGEIHGVGAFAVPLELALGGSAGEAEQGYREMNAVFARHGLTGVVDGGGLLVTPRDYDPLYAAWRRGELDVRARLFLSAWSRGGEVDDIQRLTSLVQPDSGDDVLRIVGIGEIPHLGCHDMEGLDPFTISDKAYRELTDIVRQCAERSWRMSIHAVLDSTLTRIIDAWEQVERETGRVSGRGFSIVHADEASRLNLERLARLGAGVLVQSRLVLKGSDYVERWGAAATAEAPPIGAMKDLGIMIGGGTDATRANWFSPWASIWWLVTGGTLGGEGVRSEPHRLSRVDAIAAFTRNAAWFTGEQGHRGRLLPGFDADLCVPTNDPLTCDEDELRDILSDLTMMGGRITHDSGVLTGSNPGEEKYP